MSADRGPSLGSMDLETHVEWGGRTWVEQVRRGLDWLGPLDGLRILEVGAREGGMSVLLGRMGAEVVGIDLDERWLSVARDRARAAGLEERVRFELRSGDPADLPSGFDVVFTKSVLVLTPDLAAIAEGLHRVLVPSGRLLAVENARGSLPVHLLRMAARGSLRPRGARYFTPRELRQLHPWFDVRLERWTAWPPTVLIGAVRR